MRKLTAVAVFAAILVTLTAFGQPPQRQPAAGPSSSAGSIRCIDGMAAGFPCRNVNLLSHLPLSQIGAENATIKGTEHWGWTDPLTGREYVLFGLTNGTAFIDITDRENPAYLGKLPTHQGTSTYRDFAVYGTYAFIVADIPTTHGMQIFDLTQLRNVANPPVTFAETAHYSGFSAGHSLWMNAETGYLYAFRTVGDTCGNAIHMIDVRNPLQPAFAGCFAQNDTPLSNGECLIYRGPDADYAGREICFVGSDNNVMIGDVTDKSSPTIISTFVYDGIERAHQGALTPDQRYWLLGDMMDEHHNGHNTRTYAFDVTDLDNPVVLGHYSHTTAAVDHDLYIIGNLAYEANWRAGLRVLDVGSLPGLGFRELGYFDIVPGSDSVAHSGAFNPYPWWRGGVVTISGTEEGLFVLQPTVKRRFLPVVLSGGGQYNEWETANGEGIIQRMRNSEWGGDNTANEEQRMGRGRYGE